VVALAEPTLELVSPVDMTQGETPRDHPPTRKAKTSPQAPALAGVIARDPNLRLRVEELPVLHAVRQTTTGEGCGQRVERMLHLEEIVETVGGVLVQQLGAPPRVEQGGVGEGIGPRRALVVRLPLDAHLAAPAEEVLVDECCTGARPAAEETDLPTDLQCPLVVGLHNDLDPSLDDARGDLDRVEEAQKAEKACALGRLPGRVRVAFGEQDHRTDKALASHDVEGVGGTVGPR